MNKNNQQNKMRKQKQRIPKTPSSGVPTRTMVSLKYSDLIALAPGAAVAQYTFRGNSVFDPDYTSTGHQPRYFDQWAAFYQKYKVVSSRMHISVSNFQSTAGVIAVVIPHTDILTLTNYYNAAEMPLMKRTEQIPISTRQGGISSVISAASTRQICGLSEAQLASEDYSATVGANPLSIWYWNIGFFGANGVNVSVSFDIDIEYQVLFYERSDPGAS